MARCIFLPFVPGLDLDGLGRLGGVLKVARDELRHALKENMIN